MVDTPLTTATANFSNTVVVLIRKSIERNLQRATRWMVPGSYMAGEIIPGTNQIRHVAYGELDVDHAATLTEGTPPEEEPLTIAYDTYGASQRGRLVAITDVALGRSPHKLAAAAIERLGRNAARTADKVFSVAAMAGANAFWAADATSEADLATTDIITRAEVQKRVSSMKTAGIEPFGDGFYVCITHPNAIHDLMSDTSVGGWIEASKYAAPDQLLNGEMGRLAGVRFVESTVGTWVENAAGPGNVTYHYKSIFFGPDYIGWGDEQTTESYVVEPGGDHADPLAQKWLGGWKGMWGAAIVDAAGAKYQILNHAGSLAGAAPLFEA